MASIYGRRGSGFHNGRFDDGHSTTTQWASGNDKTPPVVAYNDQTTPSDGMDTSEFDKPVQNSQPNTEPVPSEKKPSIFKNVSDFLFKDNTPESTHFDIDADSSLQTPVQAKPSIFKTALDYALPAILSASGGAGIMPGLMTGYLGHERSLDRDYANQEQTLQDRLKIQNTKNYYDQSLRDRADAAANSDLLGNKRVKIALQNADTAAEKAKKPALIPYKQYSEALEILKTTPPEDDFPIEAAKIVQSYKKQHGL